MRLSAGGLVPVALGLILLSIATVASAQEGTDAAQGALRFKLFNVPIDPPERASRELLGNEPPPAHRSPEWTILPDGSARYGNDTFSVIVTPRCQPTALPGRAVR